jgi:hypothetical protein
VRRPVHGRGLEASVDVLEVFHLWDFGIMWANEFPPFGEGFGLAEAYGVVFDGGPGDGERVLEGCLDSAVEAEAQCSRGFLEERRCLCDCVLECKRAAGPDGRCRVTVGSDVIWLVDHTGRGRRAFDHWDAMIVLRT